MSRHCQEWPRGALRMRVGPRQGGSEGAPGDARAKALVQLWDFATQALPSGNLGVLIY